MPAGDRSRRCTIKDPAASVLELERFDSCFVSNLAKPTSLTGHGQRIVHLSAGRTSLSTVPGAEVNYADSAAQSAAIPGDS